MEPLTAQRTPARGFTLIEVLVVVLIIAVMVGVVGVNLARDARDVVREEADRLALLLQAAQQEAIVHGQLYAWGMTEGGYHFLRLDDKNRLRPVKDELLRARALPAGVRLTSFRIEGVGDSSRDGLVIPPSGELPPFTAVLAAGDVSWQVVGTAQGQIRSMSPADVPPR